MGDLPLPPSSAPGVLSRDPNPDPLTPARAVAPPAPDNTALLGVLRQAVTAGTLSTDSLLNAIADAARVLSGAHGTAIASRVNGLVVCRARSGDMAPPLGAPLNTESGISGECLRTAAILVCGDTSTDERVDPEVCSSLGIRSVAVVPLRGRNGMLGILEAFSDRADAFQEDQINSLRALAQISEEAYERERAGPPVAPAAVSSSRIRPALFAAPIIAGPAAEGIGNLRFSTKYYWIVGAACVVLLLATIIVRLSWRQTGAEIAASEPHPQPVSTVQASSADTQGRQPAKPDAAVTSRKSDRSPVPDRPQNSDRAPAKDVVKNAAEIEPAADNSKSAPPKKSTTPKDAADTAAPTPTPAAADSDVPPTIEIASSSTPEEIARLTSASAEMPELGVTVSQGVVEANLLHKVAPVYPAAARSRGVTGSVVLDAAIKENGAVGKVKIVSGPAILADAAISALHEWRYSPTLLNGKPVPAQKRITFVFKLP